MDTSQPDNQAAADQSTEQYETHTTALIFLVIVVIIISFVALRGGEGVGPLFDGSGSTQQTEEVNPDSHGSLIPQREVETTDTTSLSDLPSGIFVEEDRIISNKLAEGNHQIVKFESDRSVESLFSTYETWMNDADYEINQELEDDDGAKLAARGPDGQQLTVAITRPDESGDATRIMIDYVAAQ